jgi:hypothetical protein
MTHAITVLIYVVAAFLALLQVLLIWKMANNTINLKFLIADDSGDASLSRFQLLLFTFVISAGILYLTVKGDGFPRIDQGVLILLGISSASYALGKSLDKQAPAVKEKVEGDS